jgi:TnpA family transposase
MGEASRITISLGTVSALELMWVLQRGKTPSTLSRAIQELGRIAKTLYLLNYVDDEDYRCRILTQLNRGEGRHRLARAIFYGRKGEIRQPYRQGQEDQLSALGLVANVIVLWNTLYIDLAVKYLQDTQMGVNAEASRDYQLWAILM